MGALALGAVALGAGCGGEVDASSARAGQTDAGSGAGGALAPPDENGGSTTLPGESEGGPDAIAGCGQRLADLRPEGDAPCSGAGCTDYKDHPGYVYEWKLNLSDVESRACVLSELLTRGLAAEEHPQWGSLRVKATYEDMATLLPLRDMDYFTLHCAGDPVECCGGDFASCRLKPLCVPMMGSRWDPDCQCWHEEPAGCTLSTECLSASITATDPSGRCWGFSPGCAPVGWGDAPESCAGLVQ